MNNDSVRTGGDATPTSNPADALRPIDGEGASLAEAPAGDGAALHPEQEADIWVGRTHWKHFAGRLALWLAANAVLAILLIWAARHVEWLTFRRGFAIVAVVFVVSGLEICVRRVLLRIIDHRYRLTSQRLFIERGILSQTVDQTELIRVDDVRIYKSFFDRVFGLGSVAIVSTDATDREIVIAGIPEPEQVAEAIRTRMRAMRRKSLFLEHL